MIYIHGYMHPHFQYYPLTICIHFNVSAIKNITNTYESTYTDYPHLQLEFRMIHLLLCWSTSISPMQVCVVFSPHLLLWVSYLGYVPGEHKRGWFM